EIALLICLRRPAKSAGIHTLPGASDFSANHAGASNRLTGFIINDASRRFVSLLCDAQPDVNSSDFISGGDLDDFRLIFIGRVWMPGARVLAPGPGRQRQTRISAGADQVAPGAQREDSINAAIIGLKHLERR